MNDITNVVIAHMAGVIDLRGYITTRRLHSSTIPVVSVALKQEGLPLINYLCQLTDVSPVTMKRDYNRYGCSQHCPEAHNHVVADQYRWMLAGAKARVVLQACLPYLLIQVSTVQLVLDTTLQAGYKRLTYKKMQNKGWPVNLEEFSNENG